MRRLALPALALCALGLTAASPAGAPQLGFPVVCEVGRTCVLQHYVDRDPGPGTRDYRCGLATYQGHTAVDIRVPDMAAMRRGVTVVAAAAGTVRYTRNDVPDRPPGQATGPADPKGCGNGLSIDHGGGWTTGYCHMAMGSVTVKPGQAVAAGQPLGRIGITGNSDFPHLHFDVRHGSAVVDPFAPDMAAACGAAQAPLWTPAVAAKLRYQTGAVLNAGFAGATLTPLDLEAAKVARFDAGSPYVVFYARAIALQPGDEVELELTAPDGTVLAKVRRPALKAWRAQDFQFVGDKRPAAGFPKGRYVGDYRVWRGGKVAISRRVEARL
jgi:hypothetical protein